MIPDSTVEQAATSPRELPVAMKNSIGPKEIQQQKKHQERRSTSDDNVVGPECGDILQPVPISGPQPKTINIASTEATAKALEHGADRNEPHAVSPDNMGPHVFAGTGSGGGHVSTEACISECSSLQRSKAPASGGKASTDDTSVLTVTKDTAQIVSSLEQKDFSPHFEKQAFAPHRWPTLVTSSTVAASSCTGVESYSSSSPSTMCAPKSTPTGNPSNQQQTSTETAPATTEAAVAGTSFPTARILEISRSSAIVPALWHVSYPGVGNVHAQETSSASPSTEALSPPAASLPFRPEADSPSSPTPSALWLVQEALSVKEAVDAAVRGASYCSSDDVKAVAEGISSGDESKPAIDRSQGSMTSISVLDDAAAEIPRVMADLRAALGRGGMTSSEAKAWVEELDRLGEGLGRDGLRKDYPPTGGSSCISTSAAADPPSALTVSVEQPPQVVPSDPDPDPVLVTAPTGVRRQSQDSTSRQALLSAVVSGDTVDQSPLLLGSGESAANGEGQDAAPLPDPGMEKCNSDNVINKSSGIRNNDVIVEGTNKNDDPNSHDVGSSSKGGSSKDAERRSEKQPTQGDAVASPVAAASAFVSSRTRSSGRARIRSGNGRQTTRSEERSASSLLKSSVTVTTRSESAARGSRERAGIERNNNASVGNGGGLVKQRERRNASKFPDDVIVKIPCLCADLNAALGRNVLISEVKDCLRTLDGKGEGWQRQALMEACMKLLRRKPKRETHRARELILLAKMELASVTKKTPTESPEVSSKESPVKCPTESPEKSSKQSPEKCPTESTEKSLKGSTEKCPTKSPEKSPNEPLTESKEAFSRRKKRSRSCVGQNNEGINDNGACSGGSGGSSCRNREGGGGRAAIGAAKLEEKEGVVASRKVARDGIGHHMMVPRRSRGLLPESVIAKVPRLLVDMAGVLGYSVSANEAKAQCRELEGCGEGLTSKELCDACVCLLLRRANRTRIRTRGRAISNRSSKSIIKSSSSNGVKQEKKEKDAAQVLDKAEAVKHGGGLDEKKSEARSSAGSEAVPAKALGASEKSCDAKEEVLQEAVLKDKAELLEEVALSKAESGDVLGVREADDERVKKKPRRAVWELPESVVAKLPGLVLDLETFVGRPVSIEEVEERCRQLERGGEGLTHQELCDACVSLLLRIDDQNLIGSGESVHISPPGSVTEKRPFGGRRIFGGVHDRSEFTSSPEDLRVPVPLATYSTMTGLHGNVEPPNIRNQRGACDIPPEQDTDDVQDSEPLEIAGESSPSEIDEDSDGCTENRELDDGVVGSSSPWSCRDVDGVNGSSDARLPVQSGDEGDGGKMAVMKMASTTTIGGSYDGDMRVAAVEAGTDGGESHELLQGEVGEFAVFPAPSGSSVPFLVGKILEKRIGARNRSDHGPRRSSIEGGDQGEVLVHWFTLKKITTRTMTKVEPNDGIGSSKCEVPSNSAVEAAIFGGWAPVYVPCPRSKRLKRDTGVECLAAAILVFPGLLSSDALPASVRELLKYAVVNKATTAASKAEGRGASAVGDSCVRGGETKVVERKKSILDRCDDSDFEDGTF